MNRASFLSFLSTGAGYMAETDEQGTLAESKKSSGAASTNSDTYNWLLAGSRFVGTSAVPGKQFGKFVSLLT